MKNSLQLFTHLMINQSDARAIEVRNFELFLHRGKSYSISLEINMFMSDPAILVIEAVKAKSIDELKSKEEKMIRRPRKRPTAKNF
jgi:hypothetical protein